MTFEEKIIKNSSIRQKNLMRPAKIAFEKPDTGVTINKKGAYYLIKDSAEITIKYASLLCYGSYSNPLKDLKGVFTQSEIIDFVGRSKEENHTKQLLNIILTDIGCINQPVYNEDKEETNIDFTLEDEIDDVYGDYEIETTPTFKKSKTKTTEKINVDDASGIIQKLIEVFEAK
tara:strand:+ start:2399 stop:2920 length:522 start_codon:yes stop_codon:yes gene_type:complete